jgi:secreted trypsin-like serine protease
MKTFTLLIFVLLACIATADERFFAAIVSVNNGVASFVCSGALLNPTYVLTTSSCVSADYASSSLYVVDHTTIPRGSNGIGNALDLNAPGTQAIQVSNIVRNSNNNVLTGENDLAILQLKSKMVFTNNEGFWPIKAPTTSTTSIPFWAITMSPQCNSSSNLPANTYCVQNDEAVNGICNQFNALKGSPVFQNDGNGGYVFVGLVRKCDSGFGTYFSNYF